MCLCLNFSWKRSQLNCQNLVARQARTISYLCSFSILNYLARNTVILGTLIEQRFIKHSDLRQKIMAIEKPNLNKVMSSLKRRKLSLRGINSRPSLVTHIYYYTVISTLFTTFIQVFTIVLHKFQPKLQTIHELNFYYPRHVSCFIKGSIRLKRHERFICIKIILNTHWLSILLSTWKICIKLRC